LNLSNFGLHEKLVYVKPRHERDRGAPIKKQKNKYRLLKLHVNAVGTLRFVASGKCSVVE